MEYIDDRTEEQMKTHKFMVTCTDKFMSGWGKASNGLSKCAWTTDTPHRLDLLYDWVVKRGDMKYVNTRQSAWNPRNAVHVHIYVADDNHPAFNFGV